MSNMKRLTGTPMRTVVPQSSHPPISRDTSFLTLHPTTSPSKSECFGHGEHGTITAHPYRIITSLQSVVQSRSNVPGPITHSDPPSSPSLSRNRRLHMHEHTLVETIVFVAFVYATMILFSALAGRGYVPRESDLSASRWRAWRPDIFASSKSSASRMYSGLLRRTELEGQATATEDSDGLYLDIDAYFPGIVPYCGGQCSHQVMPDTLQSQDKFVYTSHQAQKASK